MPIYGKAIKGSGFTKPPKRFQFYQALQSNGNYPITIPGWYRIHVIGKGGSGGGGGSARTANRKTGGAISSGGSSGSTGAYAVSEVLLPSVGNLTVSVTTEGIRLIAKGEQYPNVNIFASHGVHGNRGYDKETYSSANESASRVYPNSANNVIASGGNKLNLKGVSGESSEESYSSFDGLYYYSHAGKGQTHKNALTVYTPNIITPSNESALHTDPNNGRLWFGGAGAGGDGVWTYSTTWKEGQKGGNGGKSAVVLEIGSYI